MTDTVLVTGGAGYVGSHICLALAKAGYGPVAIDDLSDGHCESVRFGPLEEIDIRHRGIEALVARYRPIAVIHAAAKSQVAASFRDTALYDQVNVLGTRNVVRACRAARVPHVVMISSAAIYGQIGRQLIDETAPTQPINPYGKTKLSGEIILADESGEHGSWVSLRLFNVAGAAPEAGLGENHKAETHLIPLALRASRGDTGPLSLYGNMYPTTDGSAVRDYVHVMDVAKAVVLALRYLRSGGASDVFNIGSGIGSSVMDVVKAVELATGQHVPLLVEGPREGDPPILVADITKAARTLGFQPTTSDLKSIVADAMAWETRRLALLIRQDR